MISLQIHPPLGQSNNFVRVATIHDLPGVVNYLGQLGEGDRQLAITLPCLITCDNQVTARLRQNLNRLGLHRLGNDVRNRNANRLGLGDLFLVGRAEVLADQERADNQADDA